jgi:hypothetical protein
MDALVFQKFFEVHELRYKVVSIHAATSYKQSFSPLI